MRFGLFCTDVAVQPFINALARPDSPHELVCIVQTETHPFSTTGTHARIVSHWQDLLASADVEAVLVGGTDDQILEGSKQLAAAGLPLFFLPSAAQGSTFIYEISLVHDDNHVPLIPVNWHTVDLAASALKDRIQNGSLGRIQFVTLQRQLANLSATTPVSPAAMDAELLPDVELLRWLLGDYDQVTCLRTASGDNQVLMQSVVLSGRGLPEAHWTAQPVAGSGRWQLMVQGEKDTAELLRDPSSFRWIDPKTDMQFRDDLVGSATKLLDQFAGVIPAQAKAIATQNPSATSWSDLVKCFETIDATHRSVRRRRTIELHFEPMSERAIFKTQMTAIGCGLLMATLFFTLCYLGIATLIPLPEKVLIGLRFLVFAPLVLFLLAQVLLPLTRPSSSEQSHS